jgi:hypothetical protein
LCFRPEHPISGGFCPQGETGDGLNGYGKTGETVMRVLIVACFVAGFIAVTAAVVLDNFVQESASVAFAEPSVRL